MRTEPTGSGNVKLFIIDDKWIEVDPLAYWENLSRKDFNEQLDALADDHYWMVQLHALDRSDGEKEVFWKSFSTDTAARERRKAIHGNKHTNFEKARDNINHTLNSIELREACLQRGDLEGATGHLACAAWIWIEIIETRDHKLLSQMAEILKHGRTPPTEKTRGGEDSELGQMFRDFCQYHINTRNIPTKKELRGACGMSHSAEDIKKAGAMMRQLGLSGLPDSRSKSG